MAWVQGSTTYATKVYFENDTLVSVCSCPYYSVCKHAVAVILEYLDFIENKKNIPQTDRNDERLQLLERGSEDMEDTDNIYDASDDGDKVITTDERLSTIPGIDNYLEQKSKEELLNMVKGIITHHPEIRDEINYKTRIDTGKPSVLVKAIEKEIAKVSKEPGWQNHWKNIGYTPDYSRVRNGLQKLLDKGHADEIVQLGEKLFSAGVNQIEQSHDEGETADEVADSLKIVFDALGKCSMECVDKMERAVDFGLRDQYGICHGLEVFWKRKYSKKNWGLLADRLLERISNVENKRQEDSFSRDYQRDRLTDEILRVLGNAGREEEALALCRQEAEKTHSYVRLVKHLRKSGHTAEAEEWICKGIAATYNRWPGIAASLKSELLNIRSLKGDWLYVAALYADDFLERPGLKAFEDLKKASEKAKLWHLIREAMLSFLETGKFPKQSSGWPLSDTGIEKSDNALAEKAPYINVLIDIAIHEKRTDDVLKWYEVYKQRRGIWPEDALKDSVASAIGTRYPDKAVAIFKELAERHISMTNVTAYGVGAKYLRKAQRILKQNSRETELNDYLSRLKEANRRKPRCIQILNALSEKPIIRGSR